MTRPSMKSLFDFSFVAVFKSNKLDDAYIQSIFLIILWCNVVLCNHHNVFLINALVTLIISCMIKWQIVLLLMCKSICQCSLVHNKLIKLTMYPGILLGSDLFFLMIAWLSILGYCCHFPNLNLYSPTTIVAVVITIQLQETIDSKHFQY